MGKKRLLRCILRVESKLDKTRNVIFVQNDIDALEPIRKKAFKILSEDLTHRFIDIQEILVKIELVLTAKEIFVGEGKEVEVK